MNSDLLILCKARTPLSVWPENVCVLLRDLTFHKHIVPLLSALTRHWGDKKETALTFTRHVRHTGIIIKALSNMSYRC